MYISVQIYDHVYKEWFKGCNVIICVPSLNFVLHKITNCRITTVVSSLVLVTIYSGSTTFSVRLLPKNYAPGEDA